MADLQEQLQAILGDPDTMSQITAVARALTGGGGIPSAPAPPPPPPPPAETAQAAEFVPVEEEKPSTTGSEPDLSQLLSMVGGGNLPKIDPKLISAALRIYGEYSAGDDQKTALLNALKPFLREERREKIEKAVQIARLSRLIRMALQLLREEGGHV